MTTMTDMLTVWTTTRGIPERIFWRGRRWNVIDIPTPLHGEAVDVPDLITHPPMRRIGWRFTVRTPDHSDVRLIDVRHDGDHWSLIRDLG